MTITAEDWQAAGVAAVVAGVLWLGMPGLVRRLPEPDPDPEPADAEDPGDEGGAAPDSGGVDQRPAKVPYAEIGASARMRWLGLAAAAITAGLMGLAVGWDLRLVPLVSLTPVGVALAVIDWRTTLLPTRLIAPSCVVVGALVALVALLEQDAHIAVRGVVGWVAAFAFFFVLWFIHPRGMGYGDVRLSGVLGLALGQVGWATLLLGIYSAFLVGGAGGLLLSAFRLVDRKRFPFGPFMLIGAVIGVVAGPAVARSLGY